MWFYKLKKVLRSKKLKRNLKEFALIGIFLTGFSIFTIPLILSDKDEWKEILLATAISLILNAGFFSLSILFFTELYYIIPFTILTNSVFVFLVFTIGEISKEVKDTKLNIAEMRDYKINRLL